MPRLPRKHAFPKLGVPAKPLATSPLATAPLSATTSDSERQVAPSTPATHFTRGSKLKKTLEAQEDTSRTVADRLQTALLASADDSQQRPSSPPYTSTSTSHQPTTSVPFDTGQTTTTLTNITRTTPHDIYYESPVNTAYDTSYTAKNKQKQQSVPIPAHPTLQNIPPPSHSVFDTSNTAPNTQKQHSVSLTASPTLPYIPPPPLPSIANRTAPTDIFASARIIQDLSSDSVANTERHGDPAYNTSRTTANKPSASTPTPETFNETSEQQNITKN
jgi:hypothetical protein